MVEIIAFRDGIPLFHEGFFVIVFQEPFMFEHEFSRVAWSLFGGLNVGVKKHRTMVIIEKIKVFYLVIWEKDFPIQVGHIVIKMFQNALGPFPFVISSVFGP